MPQNTSKAVTLRRSQIANLMLKGWKQDRIAQQLNVSQSQVSRDIQAIESEWKDSTLIDTHTAKVRELAKLDLLESEYWAAWERSTKPITKKSKKIRGDVNAPTADAKQKPKNLETWESSEERLADPRYLDGVHKCINTRKDILGIAAPTKVDAMQRVVIVDDL